MNPQIRHVSLLVTGMFLALLISLTSLQGFARPALWESSSQYGSLTEDSRNARTIYQEYGKARGAIMVNGTAVAASVKSSDSLGYQRVYSNGPLYAPVTGYYSTIFSNMTGIENAENTVLNGSSPSLWRSRIQNLFTGDQPQGGSVELTINPTLQKVAYQALGNKRGAVVALNPKTGAILAMVSTPSFDPNLLASHDGTTADTAWKQLNSDSATPLINRAIGGDLYPPGSTFKVITASAALRLGKVTPDSKVDAPDTVTLPGTTHQLQNYAGESCGNGKVTLTYAFAESCNTTFAQLAMNVGEQELTREAEAWGFNTSSSIPLTVTPSSFPPVKSQAELAMAGIGQQSVRVTPLQMAQVAATVANDGNQMQPYLVKRTLDDKLSVISTTSPKVARSPISSTVAGQLKTMMIQVVASGTGTSAQVDGMDVAGKTGTAETGSDGGPVTWFIGYAGPSGQAPTIAIAVVLDGGDQTADTGTGGSEAAPIAATVFKATQQ